MKFIIQKRFGIPRITAVADNRITLFAKKYDTFTAARNALLINARATRERAAEAVRRVRRLTKAQAIGGYDKGNQPVETVVRPEPADNGGDPLVN